MAREIPAIEMQGIEALIDKARHYSKADPEVALGQARKAAEAIARAVFAQEIGEPGKIMLDAMLQKLAAAKAIPGSVLVPFGTIQAYGNFGVHAQGDARTVDERYVAPALAALEHVAAWFKAEYAAGPAQLAPAAEPAPAPRGTKRWLLVAAAAACGALAIALALRARPPAAPVVAPPEPGPVAHEAAPAPAPAKKSEEPAPASKALSLDLSVLAARPGEADFRALKANEALAEGDHLAFEVRVSQRAYLYLCERSGATGSIAVLFPDDRIHVQNPIEAGTWLRIPQGAASFRVDDKDLGTETVFAIASPTPIDRLDQALRVLRGKPGPRARSEAEQQLIALAAEDNPGCDRTRGLSLESDCTLRGRGLELQPEGESAGSSQTFSERRQATPQDPRILLPFSFRHVAAR